MAEDFEKIVADGLDLAADSPALIARAVEQKG